MKRIALVLAASFALSAQSPSDREKEALAEPFRGVTTDGTVVPDLFPIRATGVSTAPVVQAAERFLASLTEEQRSRTEYPVDDVEWRRWQNVHRYARQGVSFKEMDARQKEAGFDLLRAGLSAKGFEKSRDVMKLNHHLSELISDFEEYGEGLYWLTVMGKPSETEPWGWQLDGHHLVINYFVLGDRVVMTPSFMGSEPVIALSGKYQGTAVLQDEQEKGLALMSALDEGQRKKAVIGAEKSPNDAKAQAFNDNLVLHYAGIPARELDAKQRNLLLDVIQEYVGNIDDGHAKVKMSDVGAHLDDTYFAWIGDTGPDAVFYYRVQSPVILIEFDHQGPIALEGPRVASRRHVHSVVRTPNGNDYGKDLLRQHYEAHRTDPSHGHRVEPRD
ncbi:MAG: DUF3500 domain-containing protein [Vicinamibacteria bacterium]